MKKEENFSFKSFHKERILLPSSMVFFQDPLSPEGSWYIFNKNAEKNEKRLKERKCKKCFAKTEDSNEGHKRISGDRVLINDIETFIKNYIDGKFKRHNH